MKRADRPLRYDFFAGEPIPVWELSEEKIDLKVAGEEALRCVRREKRGLLSSVLAAALAFIAAAAELLDIS